MMIGRRWWRCYARPRRCALQNRRSRPSGRDSFNVEAGDRQSEKTGQQPWSPLTATEPPGRWSFGRKAATAQAFIDGQLDAATIKQRFDIDLDELSSWVDRYVRHGTLGLRTTRLQCYRKPCMRSVKPRHRPGLRKPRTPSQSRL